jgi:hypothetical protein
MIFWKLLAKLKNLNPSRSTLKRFSKERTLLEFKQLDEDRTRLTKSFNCAHQMENQLTYVNPSPLTPESRDGSRVLWRTWKRLWDTSSSNSTKTICKLLKSFRSVRSSRKLLLQHRVKCWLPAHRWLGQLRLLRHLFSLRQRARSTLWKRLELLIRKKSRTTSNLSRSLAFQTSLELNWLLSLLSKSTTEKL